MTQYLKMIVKVGKFVFQNGLTLCILLKIHSLISFSLSRSEGNCWARNRVM